MENSELVMFDQTIKITEDDVIFIKPLCDFFEIDYENQVDRINTDRILKKSSVKKPNKIIFGDNYPRICLTKKGFVRWIEILNSNTVAEHLKEKFEIYQEMIFDYMYGKSINIESSIKRQYDIDVRKKEINRQITQLLTEGQSLDKETKQLSIGNYAQLGLVFPDTDNYQTQNLKSFAQKSISNI